MNRDNFFARATRAHDRIMRLVSPCARFLYQELLRLKPPGTIIEFEFADFQAEQTYSDRWIRHALNELIEHGLVEVIRKFGAGVYRLIAFYPKKENEPIDTFLPAIEQSTSEKQPSNADSLAPLYREKRETTNRPSLHPVRKNERERVIASPPTPKQPEPEIAPEVSQQIEACGFRLNTTLATIVRSTTAQIVLQAIEATQEYQRKLKQRNQPLKREPEAILVAAIKDAWKPTGSDMEDGTLPDGFDEWFELAKEVGLVGMSSAQADLTGHPTGVLCVLTVSGEWEVFDGMRRLHSVDELREAAGKRRSAMEFTPSPRLMALQMEGD